MGDQVSDVSEIFQGWLDPVAALRILVVSNRVQSNDQEVGHRSEGIGSPKVFRDSMCIDS